MAKRKTDSEISSSDAPARGVPTDWSRKNIFTTGEAAEVCKVSQQTIIRSFDAGRLSGFKVPGSKFRRIPRDELVRFMRDNAMPLDALSAASTRVLAVCGPDAASALGAATQAIEGLELRACDNLYEAGILTERLRPMCVVFDARLMGRAIGAACAAAKSGEGREGTLVLVCPGDPVAGADGAIASLNSAEIERWLRLALMGSAATREGDRASAGGSN
jgi:excisionase family DNA binding protein